jgi:DNA invertase Pin-like site-specific DNA recombinase
LKQIESNKIPKQSVLIVENLDRLSREEVSQALAQFLNIINAGIKVVTLQDGREYTKESVASNWSELIISITIMSRANEESAGKSKRLSASWDHKRKTIDKFKMTNRCPAWLQLKEARTAFEIIPGRDKVIQSIYRMRLDGMGPNLIAKRLNESSVWQPSNGWRESYIIKILRTSAVIGEYQPHKMIDGKRQPIGDSIPDYFPPIIPLETFNAVRQIHFRNTNSGRTGKATNIFRHLVKCGSCGGSMVLIDHGASPRSGGKRLACDKARRSANDCQKYSIRYYDFEQKVLSCIQGLSVEDLIPSHDALAGELDHKREGLLALMGEMKDIERLNENLMDSIAGEDNAQLREALGKRSKAFFARMDEIRLATAQTQLEIHQLESLERNAEERIRSVNELFEQLAKADESSETAIRLKLAERLKRILKKIIIHQHGMDGMGQREIILEYLAVSSQMRRTRYPWPESSR